MPLDGEAIAFTAAGRPQAFQVTMRRFGRRLDVERMMGELPIQAFFFDCLLLDGRELIGSPLRDRTLALRKHSAGRAALSSARDQRRSRRAALP
jgi:DNA ligase-1